MKVLVMFLVGLVAWPLEAWALMVAVGVVHGEWLTEVPTLSYSGALRICLALSLVGAVIGLVKGLLDAIGDE